MAEANPYPSRFSLNGGRRGPAFQRRSLSGGGVPSGPTSQSRALAGQAGAAACQAIENQYLRAACLAAAAVVGGGGNGNGEGGSSAPPGEFTGTGAGGTCPEGTFRNPVTGNCTDLIPGGAVSGGGIDLATGEAVLGQFGVAMVPAAMERIRLRCPRGMVLGMDNLCYNRRELRKSERKWVPPRKPLLTGGELNAISTALSAAKKLDRQKKRLRKTAKAFERAS